MLFEPVAVYALQFFVVVDIEVDDDFHSRGKRHRRWMKEKGMKVQMIQHALTIERKFNDRSELSLLEMNKQN